MDLFCNPGPWKHYFITGVVKIYLSVTIINLENKAFALMIHIAVLLWEFRILVEPAFEVF